MFTQGSWLNAPENWSADGAQLRVTTDANTDFWRKTSYGFIRDSGHFFGTQHRWRFHGAAACGGAVRSRCTTRPA